MTTRDAGKAALFTALFTFIGTFGLTLLGWLADVAAWASSSGAHPLPGLSVLGYALVAAVVAAASGLVNFAVRWAQARGIVAGNGPTYGSGQGQAGQTSSLVTVVLVLVGIAAVILIVRVL